jgi:repressor LexA
MDNTKSIVDRIRALANAQGLSLPNLEMRLNLGNGTISRWSKSSPNSDKLLRVADYFHVPVDYLLGREASASLPANLSPMPVMKRIPLLGSIACGAPILADEHIEDFVDMPSHIHADFSLTCKGDSMINARIFDGDIVYIRQQDTVDNGQIAAVLIDGEATLKRVRLFDDHISLEPENPQYRPIVLWGEDMNTVRILGRAVAFTSTIR